ncbi:DUF3408 domain-containing protein [Flavobacterium sp. UBA4197]|uniref:DUF3408 domain-containing protein n=1 Tax=Flavobacterium sp. UBA4197 TaxID=1946546 RepID=UPI00257BB835|nr:DUF3408 domain-containing protein [Flavobacterium sp. UBA4197]
MAKERTNDQDIDESFILSSIKGNKQSTGGGTEKLPTKVNKKEVELTELDRYFDLFIKESNLTARLGKSVYIRKDFHDRLLKIVQVIGGNELSLFSYLDNVLAHHFESFQKEIKESYQSKNSDIF